jgi:Domain of unknown function (DUF4352)
MAIVVSLSGCVDKQASDATTKSSELPSQYVLLNRSAELTDYVGQYAKASSGKTFLVIDMTLENHGYNSIDVNPNYFAVVIDKVAYPYDKATFSTESPLTSLSLLDGGKTSGYLVFQIPEDKTAYTLIYAGPEKANVIYGKFPTAETAQTSPEPQKPVRTITVDLGNGPRTVSQEGFKSFGEIRDSPGNLLGYKDHFSTLVDISQSGYVIQETSGGSDKGTSIDIVIKTILDENLKPKNQDQALKDEIDKKISELSEGKYKIKESGSSEKTLKNGDKVTVHNIKIDETNGQKPPRGSVNVFCYMPDSSTIVTVDFSVSSPATENLIYQTLNIGEMQRVQ